MAVQELVSKLKRKQERAGQPVIFQYDEIPEKFRVQVTHIWKDAIGPYSGRFGAPAGAKVWEAIHDFVSRELGLPALGTGYNPAENCIEFLLEQDTEQVLDIIQASFNFIEHCFGQYNGNPDWMQRNVGLSCPPDFAIAELNRYFLENDIGYQYQNGRIIRIDSQYTHSEIVLPALQLLNEPEFKPAQDEFLKAHEDYRRGRYEGAMNEALKAFESTMKIIGENRGWPVDPNAAASRLIQTCFEHQLIPTALQSHFTGLRTTLESGLPTVRNRYSGHGDGVRTVEVPGYLAQYALNLAASNIVLLINAHRVSTKN
jgi:hypothetical protein